MAFSLALHVIGLVLWVGGLMFIARIMTLASDGEIPANFGATIKRIFLGYVLAGLVLSTITGLFQLSAGGVAQYMKQGWMHMKLTFVLALYVISALLAVKVFALEQGRAAKRSGLMALHGVAALCLLAIVVVTFVMR